MSQRPTDGQSSAVHHDLEWPAACRHGFMFYAPSPAAAQVRADDCGHDDDENGGHLNG